MIFTLKHNGKVYRAKNKIMKEGLQLLRDGSPSQSKMICLPIQGTAVSFLDTLASHPGWDYVPTLDYSGSTLLLFPNLPTANTMVSTNINWFASNDFTLDGIMTYWNAPYFSDRTGQSLHIFSAAILPSPIEAKTGDQISVFYTIAGEHNAIT